MEITVHHSAIDRDGTRMRVVTEVTDDNGETKPVLHIFPVDTIEWRVAQLNISAEEALDTILAEPYIKDMQDTDLIATRSGARTKRAAEVKAAVSGITYQLGPPPENTVPDNLEDHSGDGDPKAFILAKAPIDDHVVTLKRAVMDVHREVAREAAARPKFKGVQRRAHGITPADPPQEETTVRRQPSDLANRLIEKRLDLVRSHDAVAN